MTFTTIAARVTALLAALFLTLALGACEEEGAMEQTGKAIDETADKSSEMLEEGAKKLEEGAEQVQKSASE